MKKVFLLLVALMTLFPVLGNAKGKAQSVSFKYQIPNHQMAVDVQFLTSDIVRVRKWPLALGEAAPQKKSYSVILTPEDRAAQKDAAQAASEGNTMRFTSKSLVVRLNTQTGQLTFQKPDGQTLLTETDTHFKLRHGDADEGKYIVSQAWKLDKEEAIFGLGQLRDGAMNQRGRKVKMWNTNTYTSIPYFTSQKGYGLYWDNAGRSFFEDNEQGTSFLSEVALCTDYYFLYRDGTQDAVIDCIRQLTGQATLFPLWTMGHWQCRERYKTSDELASVLDRYRQLGIPLDGIVQDWQYWGCDSNWNAMRFMNPYYINKVGDPVWAKYLPDDLKPLAEEYVAKGLSPRLKSPEEMVDYVHRNHAHLMISIWASFGPWTEPYAKLKEIGALLPFDTWPRNRGVMPYDPFNPKARDIYWQYLSHLWRMGFDAWWTDSTEPDHFEKEGDDDVMTYDGTWRSVKNAYPLMTNKGIYEHQRAMKGNAKRSVQMTRSGAFGIQHYGTFSWSGDIGASWDEMKKQIPSGLNYTLCGIPFWNTDIGGFFYWDYWNDPKNPALQELHTRWMQWGTFMPLMRNHGSSPMPTELYHFGNPGDWAYDVQVDAVRLRYRLLPYIYSTAADCALRSGSMMRAFVMDFPGDKEAINRNDEYLFGRQILVKPVTDPLYTWRQDQHHGYAIYPDIRQAAAPVSVYLPKDEKTVKGTSVNAPWYDFFTNQTCPGGQSLMRPTPITQMPVYVRAGTILPFGPEVKFSAEKPWDDLEIRVYPGADGQFTLYEDEGDGYGYEQGRYTEIPFQWDEATRTLTIGQRRGQYKGMIAQRTFRIVKATPTAGVGPTASTHYDATVNYTGQQLTVSLP